MTRVMTTGTGQSQTWRVSEGASQRTSKVTEERLFPRLQHVERGGDLVLIQLELEPLPHLRCAACRGWVDRVLLRNGHVQHRRALRSCARDESHASQIPRAD